MERGEWREGDHHTQRSSSFFLWTNSRLTLGCPACLSFSLMCSPRPLLPVLLPLLPRRPGQQHIRHGVSAVAAKVPRPAASCQQHLSCHGAPTSSFPMALRHGARPAVPPPRCPGQQHLRNGAPTSSTSATAPRPATNLTRRRKVLWFG